MKYRPKTDTSFYREIKNKTSPIPFLGGQGELITENPVGIIHGFFLSQD
jgi:hypothetical protein